MKIIFQGLLVVSYAALSRGSQLRATVAAAVPVTTPGPLIGAIIETEEFLNVTVKRYAGELATMSTDLATLNRTLKSWDFNIGVLQKSEGKDEALINNNTLLLASTAASVGLDVVAAKMQAVNWTLQAQDVAQKKLMQSLLNGDANKKKSSAKNGAVMTLLPRVRRIKRAYLLNGTKMERSLAMMKRVEGNLAVNSTLLMERVLRRNTDEALAEIPKEFQRQVEDTMKGLTKLSAAKMKQLAEISGSR